MRCAGRGSRVRAAEEGCRPSCVLRREFSRSPGGGCADGTKALAGDCCAGQVRSDGKAGPGTEVERGRSGTQAAWV